MSTGSENLAELLEYRDLSSWEISIPDLVTSLDSSGKACFVFVVEVHSDAANSANTVSSRTAQNKQWKINRQYHEFYALESKLTEFHGEFSDARLPPKLARLFSGRGLDVMQAKKEAFEEYLRSILQKPALKGSDILFTFLTSSEEFTAFSGAASNLGLGRMIKNVPIKLAKERGQGLLPFISNFMAQTQPEPPKPRQE